MQRAVVLGRQALGFISAGRFGGEATEGSEIRGNKSFGGLLNVVLKCLKMLEN